jgi:sugar lactone lactonase YvrE
MGLEQVTDVCAYHAEGPIWDAGAGLVRWVDMLHGDLLAIRPDGGAFSRRHVGEIAGAMRPRVGGGLVVGVERGFALLDDPDAADSDGGLQNLGELWSDAGVRMNDGGCDPQGRFYCGSMAYDAAPGRGSLYRLDPDRSVSTVLDNVTISNGLAWSPDGSTVYYVDSPTQCVAAFGFDAGSGTFHERRVAVAIDVAIGTPDGITVDEQGGIWVAVWNGGAVHRYLPNGRLDLVIDLPARKVTACTFGGSDLDELYITTSREDLADDEQPLAGALFRARPGICGLPTAAFAG